MANDERTRLEEARTGTADWNAVRVVRESTALPLVVNGDIRTFDDADRALAASGADAVMVGRAAQGRPWLPGQIARRFVPLVRPVIEFLGRQRLQDALERRQLRGETLREECGSGHGRNSISAP